MSWFWGEWTVSRGPWTPYSPAESTIIERQWRLYLEGNGESRARLNADYMVDFTNCMQYRAGDTSKCRPISRSGLPNREPSQWPPAPPRQRVQRDWVAQGLIAGELPAARRGDFVEVLGPTDDGLWLCVQLGAAQGYVPAALVAPGSAPPSPPKPAAADPVQTPPPPPLAFLPPASPPPAAKQQKPQAQQPQQQQQQHQKQSVPGLQVLPPWLRAGALARATASRRGTCATELPCVEKDDVIAVLSVECESGWVLVERNEVRGYVPVEILEEADLPQLPPVPNNPRSEDKGLAADSKAAADASLAKQTKDMADAVANAIAKSPLVKAPATGPLSPTQPPLSPSGGLPLPDSPAQSAGSLGKPRGHCVLFVKVVEASDISKSDCFVELGFDAKKPLFKTAAHKGPQPVWNEEFVIDVPDAGSSGKSCTLFLIARAEGLVKNKRVGTAELCVSGLTLERPTAAWLSLQHKKKQSSSSLRIVSFIRPFSNVDGNVLLHKIMSMNEGLILQGQRYLNRPRIDWPALVMPAHRKEAPSAADPRYHDKLCDGMALVQAETRLPGSVRVLQAYIEMQQAVAHSIVTTKSGDSGQDGARGPDGNDGHDAAGDRGAPGGNGTPGRDGTHATSGSNCPKSEDIFLSISGTPARDGSGAVDIQYIHKGRGSGKFHLGSCASGQTVVVLDSGGNGGAGGRGGDAGRILIQTVNPALLLAFEASARGGAGGRGGEGFRTVRQTVVSGYDVDHKPLYSTEQVTVPGARGCDGPQGDDGAAGSNGSDGKSGADGAPGATQPVWFVVLTPDGQKFVSQHPPSLRITRLRVLDGNEDGMFQPGEFVAVSDVEVRNDGELPTPASNVQLRSTETVCSQGSQIAVPALRPGETYTSSSMLVGTISAASTAVTDGASSPAHGVTELYKPGQKDRTGSLVLSIESEGRHYRHSGLKVLFDIRSPVSFGSITAPRQVSRSRVSHLLVEVANNSVLSHGGASGARLPVTLLLRYSSSLSIQGGVRVRDGYSLLKLPLPEIKASSSTVFRIPLAAAATSLNFEHCVVQLELLSRGVLVEYAQATMRCVPEWQEQSPFSDVILLTGRRTSEFQYLCWLRLFASLCLRVGVWDIDLYDGASLSRTSGAEIPAEGTWRQLSTAGFTLSSPLVVLLGHTGQSGAWRESAVTTLDVQAHLSVCSRTTALGTLDVAALILGVKACDGFVSFCKDSAAALASLSAPPETRVVAPNGADAPAPPSSEWCQVRSESAALEDNKLDINGSFLSNILVVLSALSLRRKLVILNCLRHKDCPVLEIQFFEENRPMFTLVEVVEAAVYAEVTTDPSCCERIASLLRADPGIVTTEVAVTLCACLRAAEVPRAEARALLDLIEPWFSEKSVAKPARDLAEKLAPRAPLSEVSDAIVRLRKSVEPKKNENTPHPPTYKTEHLKALRCPEGHEVVKLEPTKRARSRAQPQPPVTLSCYQCQLRFDAGALYRCKACEWFALCDSCAARRATNGEDVAFVCVFKSGKRALVTSTPCQPVDMSTQAAPGSLQLTPDPALLEKRPPMLGLDLPPEAAQSSSAAQLGPEAYDDRDDFNYDAVPLDDGTGADPLPNPLPEEVYCLRDTQKDTLLTRATEFRRVFLRDSRLGEPQQSDEPFVFIDVEELFRTGSIASGHRSHHPAFDCT
eukprot:m51a1_g11927 hypothetical protein (1662) ;mRNA; f:682799-688496